MEIVILLILLVIAYIIYKVHQVTSSIPSLPFGLSSKPSEQYRHRPRFSKAVYQGIDGKTKILRPSDVLNFDSPNARSLFEAPQKTRTPEIYRTKLPGTELATATMKGKPVRLRADVKLPEIVAL